MDKTIETSKNKEKIENKIEDKKEKEEDKKIQFEYNELSNIINQQVMLSQKIGILMTIEYFIIGLTIPLITIFSLYYLIITVLCSAALVINIAILFPNFKQKNLQFINIKKNSKKPEIKEKTYFFYHYKNQSLEEIKINVNSRNNILNQIKINSKILCQKYFWFKISLFLTAFPFSLFGWFFWLILIARLREK